MTTAEKYYDNQKHRDYLERVLKYAYDDSGYIELFKNNPNKLPPNLAVFSRAFARPFIPSPRGMPKKQPTVPKDPPPLVVNILSVAGYGFDNKNQPDYIYFEKKLKRKDKLRSFASCCCQGIPQNYQVCCGS